MPISVNGTLVNSPATWNDMRVPANAFKLGSSNDPNFTLFKDDGSGSQGVFTYMFDPTTDEELYFAIQLDHSWKVGTDIHPHVHWCPTSDGLSGDTVSWGLEYTISEIEGIYGDTTIIYGNEHRGDDTPVAYSHYLTEIGEIDMSGITTISPMLMCRLFRDATSTGLSDTYTSDAALLEFDIHFQIDSDGSDMEYTKSF